MKNLFNSNPEFERNLLIELTSSRKIAMPLLLIAIFMLVAIFSANETTAHFIMQTTFLVSFNLLVGIWGTKLAADAIIGEQNERTWDNQRMTLLSPLQMLVGKLFGSTIFAWYGGFVCIVCYTINLFTGSNVYLEVMNLLTSIVCCIIAHSVVLILSLYSVDKFRFKNKISNVLYILIILFIGYQVGTIIFSAIFINKFMQEGTNLNSLDTATWYGMEINSSLLYLLILIVVAVWSIIGLLHSIEKEMQYKPKSKLFFSFYTSTFLIILGLFVNNGWNKVPYNVNIIIAFLVCNSLYSGFFYLVALNESKNYIELKNLYQRLLSSDFKGIYNILPTWLLTLICIAVTSLLLQIIIFFSLDSIYELVKNNDIGDLFKKDSLNIYLPINLLINLLRDMCIILFVNSFSKYKKPDTTAFIFLIAFYFLGSFLIGAILQSPTALAIIMPSINGNIFTAVLIPLVLLFFAAVALKFRIDSEYLHK